MFLINNCYCFLKILHVFNNHTHDRLNIYFNFKIKISTNLSYLFEKVMDRYRPDYFTIIFFMYRDPLPWWNKK